MIPTFTRDYWFRPFILVLLCLLACPVAAQESSTPQVEKRWSVGLDHQQFLDLTFSPVLHTTLSPGLDYSRRKIFEKHEWQYAFSFHLGNSRPNPLYRYYPVTSNLRINYWRSLPATKGKALQVKGGIGWDGIFDLRVILPRESIFRNLGFTYYLEQHIRLLGAVSWQVHPKHRLYAQTGLPLFFLAERRPWEIIGDYSDGTLPVFPARPRLGVFPTYFRMRSSLSWTYLLSEQRALSLRYELMSHRANEIPINREGSLHQMFYFGYHLFIDAKP